MLEARIKQAAVLKKLLDGRWWFQDRFHFYDSDMYGMTTCIDIPSPTAIKELVTDGNLDCTEEGIVSLPSNTHSLSRCEPLTDTSPSPFKQWTTRMSLLSH